MGQTDQVIFDDLGLDLRRRMLIMRVVEPVNATDWWARLPPEARMRSKLFDFELGETVKRHYLELIWPPREVVGFDLSDRRLQIDGWKPASMVNDGKAVAAVVWWLEEGESISGGLRSAAEFFWSNLGAWPTIGLMWKEPPAPMLGKLAVRKADWIPVGCVVVL